MAVAAACDTIRDRIAALIAERHQADPAAVRFADERVEVGGESYGWGEAVALAYQNRVSLSSTGFYKTPKVEWDRIAGRGRPVFYFAQGAAVTEVVIDTLTGENRVLRADNLHDCGASLNPAIDVGQIEGGFVQGVGWLTTEELVWNGDGTCLTQGASTYKLPTLGECPPDLRVAFLERAAEPGVVHGSKAVGEPPLMLAISVREALRAAVAAFGGGLVELASPATPEAVYWAIERARTGR
jgi:xanthine dehydrogenase large subunit